MCVRRGGVDRLLVVRCGWVARMEETGRLGMLEVTVWRRGSGYDAHNQHDEQDVRDARGNS
jgi:hypothetical protein